MGAGSGPGAKKLRLATEIVVDALAPTNLLPGNPAALKRAFETGGGSACCAARGTSSTTSRPTRGCRGRSTAAPFTVGENLAATPGKVVFRNDLIELIQYAPQTETVYEIPLLCSPPWINKYYVMDLAPGRSFVEWAVQHGHTVFAISYRNADASMRDVALDDYLRQRAERGARRGRGDHRAPTRSTSSASASAARSPRCSSPTWTQRPAHRVRSATLLNTLIDFSEPGVARRLHRRGHVERARAADGKTGFLDGDDMRAHLRRCCARNDLVWNYVVNNWLMGEDPPAFDILAWNDDCNADAGRDALASTCARATCDNELRARRARAGRRAARRRGRSTTDTYVLGCQSRTTSLRGVVVHSHAAARRRRPVRPHLLRAHRRHRQPAEPEERATGRTTNCCPTPMPGAAAPSCTRGRGGRTGRAGRPARRRAAQAAAARERGAPALGDAPGTYILDLIAHSTARFAWYS